MNNETPIKPLHKNVSALRIGLIVASCFAIGAVGFFIAVLMEHQAQPVAQQPVVKQLTAEQEKDAMLGGTSTAGTDSSGADVNAASTSAADAQNAAANDEAANKAAQAAKLKMLGSPSSK